LSAGKILVVDDEPQIRRIMKTTLIGAGYEVDEAKSGEEGIDKISRFHPDLVLLDINMPGNDGIKTADLIRNEPGSPAADVPIAFLTNSDLSIEAENWIRALG